MLVHPSSDGDDDKSKWVQTRLHEESYTRRPRELPTNDGLTGSSFWTLRDPPDRPRKAGARPGVTATNSRALLPRRQVQPAPDSRGAPSTGPPGAGLPATFESRSPAFGVARCRRSRRRGPSPSATAPDRRRSRKELRSAALARRFGPPVPRRV